MGRSKTRTDDAPELGAPRPWALTDTDAPEPQTEAEAKPLTEAQRKRLDDKGNLSTHSGTDPLGRAIGPAEDPSKIKKVRDLDGKVVTPDKDGLTPAMRKARDEVDVPADVKEAATIATEATGTDTGLSAEELALDIARQTAAQDTEAK